MKKGKKERIIENIFDLITESNFKNQAEKELKLDLSNNNITLNRDSIYIENGEGNKVLYKITIEKV